MKDNQTIVALATANGQGSVGIIRLSGPMSYNIGCRISNRKTLKPRFAYFETFFDPQSSQAVDQGIVLYFKGPNSFTGEDVVEFHGHGGPAVMQVLQRICLSQGCTLAEPGEFTKRAFLNDKIDLTQAEAIADLISASSEQAAQNAVQSLQGNFSNLVQQIMEKTAHLRTYIEATLDFSDEDIDPLEDGFIPSALGSLKTLLAQTLKDSMSGKTLQEGIHIVLIGKPNAGKSSLLNKLSKQDTAIVSDIAGTTRDAISCSIHVEGLPIHITDTAGLRTNTNDPIEKIGIERTKKSLEQADHIFVLLEANHLPDSNIQDYLLSLGINCNKPMSLLVNKTDLSPNAQYQQTGLTTLYLSTKSGEGIEPLERYLLKLSGLSQNEAKFSARQRHIEALKQGVNHIQLAEQALDADQFDLMAEELRLAHDALGSITGRLSSDDLLGKIFSTFCVGK